MSPEIVAALMLTALAGLGLAIYHALRLIARLDALLPIIERAEAAGREQARSLAALESVQEAQRAAEQVVETGASIVREVHRGIANIPFDILEAIPGTRQPSKVVRDVHDAITDSVYGALSGLNKAVGREVRRGLEAKAAAKAAADQTKPVEDKPRK